MPGQTTVDTFAEFSSPKSYKSIKIGGNGVYTKKQKRRGKVSSEYKARRKKKQARRARALQRVAAVVAASMLDSEHAPEPACDA